MSTRGVSSIYLQVLLVVVVDDGQENGHEYVRIYDDIDDEEDGKQDAMVIGWHPSEERERILGMLQDGLILVALEAHW